MIYTNHIICVQYTSQDFDQIISFLPFPLTQFLIFLKDHEPPQVEIIPNQPQPFKTATGHLLRRWAFIRRHPPWQPSWWHHLVMWSWAIYLPLGDTSPWSRNCQVVWGLVHWPKWLFGRVDFLRFFKVMVIKKRWYNYEVAHIFSFMILRTSHIPV